MKMSQEPKIEKSKLGGNIWKITDGDKIHITNQEGVEQYLKKYNERKRQIEGVC